MSCVVCSALSESAEHERLGVHACVERSVLGAITFVVLVGTEPLINDLCAPHVELLWAVVARTRVASSSSSTPPPAVDPN